MCAFTDRELCGIAQPDMCACSIRFTCSAIHKFFYHLSLRLMHNHPPLWERGKGKGTPLTPRQGRSPAPPFPFISGGFALSMRVTYLSDILAASSKLKHTLLHYNKHILERGICQLAP